MRTLPLIAVTIGDPAGIGPEIVARLFARFRPERSRALLIGALSAYGPWRERSGLDAPVFSTAEELVAKGGDCAVVLLETGVTDPFPVGEVSAGGGRHAGRALEVACELARNRSVAGIVTAPISKKSLNSANFQYPGHTEMLARYLNSPDCQMMMVFKGLRVVPLTRHHPLRDVAPAISEQAVLTCVRETHRGLVEWFGIDSPRIAVAGLNPHAGEAGVIGREEIDVIAPALEKLRAEGIAADGPFPADAMFQSAARAMEISGGDDGETVRGPRSGEAYDGYVAMYHDQGLVPFKVLAQRRGVNVTIGLPVIRTSVDHGSAFDIAGRGVAETDSLLEAYRLAETLAHNRRE